MFNVIVTTYEILKIDNVHLKSLPWRFVCADEAHRLKDKDGMTRGLVEELDKDFLLLLTGTPVQNNVGELFTLLNLMDCDEFPQRDRDDFIERYGEMNTTESVEGLSATLRSRMLRRLKDDVFKDGEVGAKEETIIWVELTAKQKQMYRGLLDKKRASVSVSVSVFLCLPVLHDAVKICFCLGVYRWCINRQGRPISENGLHH